MPKIRVLIGDDSALMRQMLTTMLESDPDIEVVGQATNGREVLTRLAEWKPDVITLDVEMPVLNGLQTLEQIMAQRPTPVVMVSSVTREGAEATLRALDLGAVDFVTKPGRTGVAIEGIAKALVEKVKTAARARVRRARPSAPQSFQLLCVASSTGGPGALAQFLADLPRALPVPTILVQHMPAGFTASLAKRLDAQSPLTVVEAAAGDTLRPGVAYLAPGGAHLVHRNGRLELSDAPPIGGLRPCADVTFESLVDAYRPILAVVLTGMGRDGTAGCRLIKQRGGTVIAQNETSCVVYGMPRAVVEAGLADAVLPLDRIAAEVVHQLKGGLVHA